MKNKTLFISDLHLDPNQPHITNTFYYFLDHIARESDALYILGDFFESYVGDDDTSEFVTLIQNALKRATGLGLPIYFMHGNRDFLIGERFKEKTGVMLLPDPSVVTIYNQSLLLMHGDSLCTDDKSHQRFRKIVNHPITQKIFLWLPLSFRKKLANQLRMESKQYNQAKPKAIMDVNENAVKIALNTHAASRLIHGHTHRPMISENRIVLDAWHDHGSYLQMDCDGQFEIITVPH